MSNNDQLDEGQRPDATENDGEEELKS